MDHASFIAIVEPATGKDREAAERAIRATLETLGERIDRDEARQLAAQLPPEVAPWIATTSEAEGFDVDEFVLRVSRREAVDPAAAQRHVIVVLSAVARAAPDEWPDVVAELPASFAPLLPQGPHVEVVDADTFVQRVADRAGLDRERAQRAIDAVLETLGERIAGGEIDDLIDRLPMGLHEPLRRGRAAGGGQATPMKLDRFLHRVAEREGVSDPEGAEHARAVFRALREAVGTEEFLDVTVQLPDDYVRALVGSPAGGR
jgi:uncharacterized protein (DUF2267 family)